MDEKFKLKMDELFENDPSQDETNYQDHYKKHETVGNTRHITFVWPDGKEKCLEYAYLVDRDYIPDQNLIVLTFTAATISLIGIRLKILFEDIKKQLAREIGCMDKRYNATLEDDEFAVNQITVKSTGDSD